MIRLVAAAVLFLCFVFGGSSLLDEEAADTPAHIVAIDRVTSPLVAEFARENDLQLSSSGGAMMDNVKVVAFGFHSKERHSIDEARPLLVALIDKLLDGINGDEALRPHLAEYPFTINRLDLSIAFLDSSGWWFDSSQGVAYVSRVQDGILYSRYNAEEDRLEPEFFETYEAAKARLG